MFRNASDLTGYTVNASDGQAGVLRNLLFDQDTWTVRYFVVQTGNWFLHQQVLISPIALCGIDGDKRTISIHSKKSMIGNSPQMNLNRPVSRRFEKKYYSYYGWPVYWGQKNRWGAEEYPSGLFTVAPLNENPGTAEEALRETNLFGTGELSGFSVYAGDGGVGKVRDFVIDDRSWEVRYIIVDAADVGKQQTAVSPHWLADISRAEKMVTIDAPVRIVSGAPPYPGVTALDREYETRLFRHYGTPDEIDAVRVRQKILA